jgi:hypothetical protein
MVLRVPLGPFYCVSKNSAGLQKGSPLLEILKTARHLSFSVGQSREREFARVPLLLGNLEARLIVYGAKREVTTDICLVSRRICGSKLFLEVDGESLCSRYHPEKVRRSQRSIG